MKGMLKCSSFHKGVDGSSSFHSVGLLSTCLIAGLITSTFPSSDSESDNWSYPEEIFRFAFRQCRPSHPKMILSLKAPEPPFPQEHRETQNYSSFHLTTHANVGCINSTFLVRTFSLLFVFSPRNILYVQTVRKHHSLLTSADQQPIENLEI